MRTEGHTQALPDTRGIPLPASPRGGVHILDRPHPAPARSGWFRRPEPGEFTPEQLRRAGYRVVGTGSEGPDLRRIPQEDREQIVAAYGAGATMAAIAADTGRDVKTIRRALTDAGVEIKRRGAPPVPRPPSKGDGARRLGDLMRANGINATQVRLWAATTGRDCPGRGLPPRALVEDYLLATTPTRRSSTT